MKIATYNVNGIRAAVTKGIVSWLKDENFDIICLQEIKASLPDIPKALFEELGYHCYWYPAQKKGYSGVAILSKQKPLDIIYGCGIEQADFEGRVIQAIFPNFCLVNTYFPSGSSGTDRQDYKMQFLADYSIFIQKQLATHSNLIVVGDYNICHQAIDIHDPKGNKNSSGFLPEEREWMDSFFDLGFTDAFRWINPHPHQYTWWSYRAGARGNNKGWRIDYVAVSTPLQQVVKDAYLLPNAMHSDHCPMVITL